MLLRSNTKKFSATTLFLAASLLGQAENSNACAKQKDGYFEGQFEVFEKFQESRTGDGPLSFRGSKLAAVDIKRTGWDGTIDIKDANTGKFLMEQIHISSKFSPKLGHLWKMNMKIDGLFTELKLRRSGDCFNGKSYRRDYTATICMKQNRNITFNIRKMDGSPVLQLNATPFSKPNIPENRPLTLKQVIGIALETSPASQEEFLQKRAARELVDIAWLKLLPRISAPAIGNFWYPLPTTPQTYAQNIGSIAPFLSINAWDAIDEARKNSEIVDIGFMISQANLVNQVEQAVYTYRKDVLLTSEYSELLDKIQKAQEQVKKIKSVESDPPYIPGDAVDDLDQALQTAVSIVKDASIANSLANDKHAIAQSLGIHDLETVRDIKIGPESAPIETATKLSLNQEADQAAMISLKYMERLQAQKATSDARGQRIKHPFKLLDFAGDPNDGIGFNLIGEFKLDKIQMQAAEVNERIVADQVRRTVLDAVENYNDSIDGYNNAMQTRDRLKGRLDTLLKPIGEFNFDHPQQVTLPLDKATGETVETVVKDYLNFINLTRGYHAAFRMARATIERAKLIYDYQQLLPEADRTKPDSKQPKQTIPGDDAIVDNNQIDMEKDTGESYHLATDAESRKLGGILP